VKALPKLAKAAESHKLRAGFEEHFSKARDTLTVCGRSLLNEEKETDEKLTELSAHINLNAIGNEQDQESTLEEFETEKEGSTDKPLKFKSRGAGSN
jgi:ferritin-like metal-binding protein YciE